MNTRTLLDQQVQEKCIKTRAYVQALVKVVSLALNACKFSFDFFYKTTFAQARHAVKISLLIKEISKKFALAVEKQTQWWRSGKHI
jgi:hypothetical protein